MRHRIVLNEYSNTVGDVLGEVRISCGGTMYYPKATLDAIKSCSSEENDGINDVTKTVYLGGMDFLKITTKKTFDIYKERLAEALDTTTNHGRQLFRFLTAKFQDYDCGFEDMRLSKGLVSYLGLDFEENRRHKKKLLICHKTREDEDTEGYYSITNPANAKRLIFLSASLMSGTGSKLIKQAINLLDLSVKDKRIIIIFNRKNESDREYEKAFIRGCRALEFSSENIILSSDIDDDNELRSTIMNSAFIYVPDGNVYETLDYFRRRNIGGAIYISVTSNNMATYIGSSAGAAVAGTDINLIDYGEFDKNEAGLEDFTGIGLLNGTVIPHYDEDEYIERLKNSAVKDGKSWMLEKYRTIARVGNEETLIV